MLPSLVALALLVSSASALPQGQAAEQALKARYGLPIEAVRRVGAVRIPHRTRQVISDDTDGEDFDVLHHLAGNSPYFNSPGVGLNAELPDGCSVTHATYLFRHTDIYANDFEYENILSPFIQKLGNFSDKSAFQSEPSLAFLSDWTSPINDPEEQVSQATDLGKKDATALGALIAQRYDNILDVNGSDAFKIWTGSATRDQDTAKAFIQGMNATLSNVTLVIVDEEEGQSANTLTPHESCKEFDTAAGSDEEEIFINTYAPGVAARLNGLAGGSSFNWTADDVFAAQALCGYDTVARDGTLSGFCHMFNENEWLAFEYANDLMYHRSLGYGSALSPVLGMPWLEASTRLLDGTANTSSTNSSAGKQNVFISFTHREEPPFVITALGLFNETNSSMPVDSINYERSWKTSQILPFLANVGLERLSCNATATGTGANATGGNTSGSESTFFIRTLVNSATIPIPGCASGPSGSCPLNNFTSFISERARRFGDFVGACGLNETNATSTLGIYEGVLPADGSAVQTESIQTNGSSSGSGDGKTNNSANGDSSNGSNAAASSLRKVEKHAGVAAAAVVVALVALVV